jgi:hypothetical protein
MMRPRRRNLYGLVVGDHPASRIHRLVKGYANGRCYAASIAFWDGHRDLGQGKSYLFDADIMRRALAGELDFYPYNESAGEYLS